MEFQEFQNLFEGVKQNPKLLVADDYELIFQKIRRHTKKFTNGEEAQEKAEEKYWASLRIFHRKRAGRCFTNTLSKESLVWLVENAFLSADNAGVDPWFKFPLWRQYSATKTHSTLEPSLPKSIYGDLPGAPYLFDEKYEWVETHSTLVRKQEKNILSFQKVKKIAHYLLLTKGEKRKISLKENINHSDKAEILKEKAQRMLSLAEEFKNARIWDEKIPHRIAFSPRILSRLLKDLSHWFSREGVERGNSPFSEKKETQIFSPLISIIDDGNNAEGWGAPFDMEGSPMQKTTLVSKGILKSFLYDTYFATRENRLSTGNYIKQGDFEAPKIAPIYFYIEKGEERLHSIEGAIGEGLYLETLDEMEEVGPFKRQLYCSGWRIINGKKEGAVFQVEINTDLRHLLSSAVQLFDDLTFYGEFGSPSILFENLPLSNE